MSKRKSIGRDPLDWIGEQGHPGGGAAENGSAEGGGLNGLPCGPDATGSGPDAGTSALLPLASPGAALQLERQLLLVDGMLSEGSGRPRLNHVLWALLFILTFLGVGILLFQETRRQWGARILSLEGVLERVEKEKGRNERILERVISEKDDLIREKQSAIARIEAIQQSTVEELRIARAERRNLLSENQGLVQRLFGDEHEGEGPAGVSSQSQEGGQPAGPASPAGEH